VCNCAHTGSYPSSSLCAGLVEQFRRQIDEWQGGFTCSLQWSAKSMIFMSSFDSLNPVLQTQNLWGEVSGELQSSGGFNGGNWHIHRLWILLLLRQSQGHHPTDETNHRMQQRRRSKEPIRQIPPLQHHSPSALRPHQIHTTRRGVYKHLAKSSLPRISNQAKICTK
jgi:hypothetical protein